jgi:TBC1 domain family member 14
MGDGSSDDESGIIPERSTKHPKSASFDFDDAFEDEDDHDPGFKLSSAAIREELARNHSLREDEDDLEAEDTSVAPSSNGRSRHSPHDTSVSTIDLGGPAFPSPIQPSLDRTPEESEYSNDFSQVSLSEDSTPNHVKAPDNSEGQGQELEMNGHSESSHPYPAVHIDASKTTISNVILAPPHTPSDLQVNPPSQDLDQVPPNSAPASSPQYNDIPSPQPKSPASPNASSPTRFVHRPMRSAGPSALEKVVSKTRPAYLPPKNKMEDNKHMADWENMMKQSRAAGKLFCIYLRSVRF